MTPPDPAAGHANQNLTEHVTEQVTEHDAAGAADGRPGLLIAGLTRRFPGTSRPVLDQVDLPVPAGGCVAVLGPSGSGKSTLLRLVAGLDTPDAGRVQVNGRDLTRVPPERRRIGLVFQRPRLFGHLDVRDNVAFPLVVAGARRRDAHRDAAAFLDLVGAADLARRRVGTLSGGQEQRVALARALAARPDVLLLDEPFSALDTQARAAMHDLVIALRAAVEPTLVLVTHDRQEAALLADTVAVLLDGRVAQHACPAELHSRPATLAVHEFLGGRNAFPGIVADGAHLSALGRLPLPDREGACPPDGPGVLVVRQEAVRVVVAHDPAADIVGTVVDVRSLGALDTVRVDVADVTVEALVPAGPRVRPRDRVGLVVPAAARHVVPAAAGPSPVSRRVGAPRPA